MSNGASHATDAAAPADRRMLIAVICVAILAGASYANTLGHGFVGDDHYLVEANPLLESSTPWSRVFFGSWADASNSRFEREMNAGYYRPLTTALLRLERGIFSKRPFGFHLISILLHMLCSCLVLLLARRLMVLWGAAFAGALFAVHAVHSEAVNAIFYQTTLLSSAFSLLALYLNGSDAEQGRTARRDIWVGLLAAAALLSKENAIVLPGLLALQDRVLLGRPWRRWRAPLYGVLLVWTLGYFLLRATALTGAGLSYFGDTPVVDRIATMVGVWGLYLRLLFWPHPLCPFYEWTIIPASGPLLRPFVLWGLAACLTYVGLVFLCASRLRRADDGSAASPARIGLFALGFFPLCLLPVLQLVPILNVAAERFIYLASAAFALLLGALLGSWVHHRSRLLRLLTIVVALLSLVMHATMTRVRNPDWKSDETLSRATLRTYPHAYSARLVLVRELRRQGRLAEARRELRIGLAQAPWLGAFRQLSKELGTHRPSGGSRPREPGPRH